MLSLAPLTLSFRPPEASTLLVGKQCFAAFVNCGGRWGKSFLLGEHSLIKH